MLETMYKEELFIILFLLNYTACNSKKIKIY